MATDPLLKGKPGRIDTVTVPPTTYLAITGKGAPEGAAYAHAVQALYTLAYGARFAGKALGHDDKVGPLEGLWWADDHAAFIEAGRREEWQWRMMIRAPGWLGSVALEELRGKALVKKRGEGADFLAALDGVVLFDLDEGPCLQALHLGPYAAEGPLIARIHAEAESRGLALGGPHHEIYLSDPRRVAADRLRTILRQPVQAA
ncbi:MAG: GyrI-like domain-containing protein [Paracoccaceae bacterium]